jgi:1,4-alpha-glucan branching enzyme
VVHGKGSLLGKMPGDRWQQFANVRLLLAYMWMHPGKKLLFMGCEFAQAREWNHDQSLDWHLLAAPEHRGVQSLVRDLNRLYTSRPALHRRDHDGSGFEWIAADDADGSTLAFLRKDEGGHVLLVVCNFTPVPRHGHRVGVPHGGHWREVFNSDSAFYGGGNLGNGAESLATQTPGAHGRSQLLSLTLPPLSVVVFEPT